MIIDGGHVRWIASTAVAAAAAIAVFVWRDRVTLGGVTGGTTAGLWFGIVGTALMVLVGSLSALRKVPGWAWLGSRTAWLRAHIWLGLLSVVFILCHSGFHWGGLLEVVLWIVFGVIVASGIFGVVLQQVLPSVLTRRSPTEVSFEQLPFYCDKLRQRADEVCDALVAVLPAADEPDSPQARFESAYCDRVRPYFQVPAPGGAFADETEVCDWFARARAELRLAQGGDLAAAARDQLMRLRGRIPESKMKEDGPKIDQAGKKLDALFELEVPSGLRATTKEVLTTLHPLAAAYGASELVGAIERQAATAWLDRIEDLCLERNRYRAQERVHRWLHAWLLIHVPLSAGLLALVIAHVVMSLYY